MLLHDGYAKRKHTTNLLCFVAGAGLAVQGLAAQPEPADQVDELQEVVVTAQLREQSSQDVPISMQAFDGDALRNLGVHDSQDVMALLPNASVTPQGGSKYTYVLRGVGSNNYHLNDVGAVGIYLDDVGLNSPFQTGFSTFDLERVEVMRGPQNTLFGRNTTGGAVNYISRKPEVGAGFNGYLDADYGRYSQADIEGGLGFALGDSTAVRLSAVSNTRDGVFHDLVTGKATGNTDRQAGRAQLLWTPLDSLNVLFNVHGGRSHSQPSPVKSVGMQDPDDVMASCPVPPDQLLALNNPDCVDSLGFNHQYTSWEDVYGGTTPHEDVNAVGGSVDMTWQVGGVRLTSLTAHDNMRVRYNEDTDGSPTLGMQFNQQGRYDQWSQELRAQSADDQAWRWIAGVFYFNEDADYATVVRRIPDPFAPSGPDMFNIVPNTIVSQKDEVYSGYAQTDYDLLDSLTATVGLRYTDESKTGSNAASVRCAGPVGGPPFCPSVPDNQFIGFDVTSLPALNELPVESLDADFHEWGARFALDWKLTDDAMLYASASRGFKSGGFSIAALQALQGLAAQPVESEILWAYETGLKSMWLEHRLQLNASVFYYHWTNLQSFQALFDPDAGTAVPQLVNIPTAAARGGEIEMQWLPGAGWVLGGGIGLLHTEIRDAGAVLGVTNGNKLPNSPAVTFDGVISKDFALGPGTLRLQVDGRYKDDVTYDLGNARNLSQAGYWMLGARSSYRFGEHGRYEVGVWGENLTGSKYCEAMYSLEGLVNSLGCQANLSKPTYGASVVLHFD